MVAATRATNATAASLAHTVAEHARQRPESVALIWHGERVTYRRLHQMADAAHAQLTAAALPPGPLAVLSKKSPEAVSMVLACLMARRPFLLPSVDLGTETLSQLVGAIGAVASLSTRADGDARHAPLVTYWLSPDAGDGVARQTSEPPEADETTFMLTTSGSTGVPKVVPLSAGAVDRFTDWAATAFGIGPGVTVLNYAPLNFDLCLLDVWATLRAGGCVALVDQDRAANPRHLRRLILETEPQVVQAVPMLFELLREASDGTAQAFDSARDVIFTGDVLPTRTRRALPRLFPAARFHNIYGCTETNDSFILSLAPDELAIDGPMTLGEPLPGVSALVVDEAGDVLDGPATGELWVATPFQTVGYLGEAAGSEKFARPRQPGHDRVHFRTGDVVERDVDGRIRLLGRNDHQLKVRGVRVNLLEVEAAINGYGGVREAAVVALPDEVATNRLHALVVPQRGADMDSLGLRAHCADRLPRAAIPSGFAIAEEPLPRNANGKVDRREIVARLRQIEGGTDG